MRMTDQEIAAEIARRELEETYVRELLASLGFDPGEGFTLAGIDALERATTVERRRAALRTIGVEQDEEDEVEVEADDSDEDEDRETPPPG